MSPVKIEKRKSRGLRFIGDWSRKIRVSDPPDNERRALRIEINPAETKHAEIISGEDKNKKIKKRDKKGEKKGSSLFCVGITD